MKTRLFLLTVFFTLFTWMFSACVKENNEEYPDVIAENDTIRGTLKYKQPESTGGKIVAWPYGEAEFKVIAGSSTVLSTGKVNADGTFMVVLPGTVSGGFLSSMADAAASQGGTVTATPNTVRFLSTLQYKVYYTFDGTAKSINTNQYLLKSDQSIEKSYFYNFCDSKGTFTGNGSYGNIFNWSFDKGWSLVESVVINSATNAFNSRTITAAPSSAVWVNL